MMNNIHALVHRLHNPDAGILLLRIALGVVFIFHGWMKISGMEGAIGFFASLGFPAFLAYFVAWSEVIGGLAFLAGIFVRYVGLILAIIVTVAIFKVRFVNGFSAANGGYEYEFVLLLGSLAMATFGAGAYSLAKYLKG